jgi:hypothetical protein
VSSSKRIAHTGRSACRSSKLGEDVVGERLDVEDAVLVGDLLVAADPCGVVEAHPVGLERVAGTKALAARIVEREGAGELEVGGEDDDCGRCPRGRGPAARCS